MAMLRKRDIIADLDGLMQQVRESEAAVAVQLQALKGMLAEQAQSIGCLQEVAPTTALQVEALQDETSRLREDLVLLTARFDAQERQLNETPPEEARDVKAALKYVESRVVTALSIMQDKADASHVLELDGTLDDFQANLEDLTRKVESKAEADKMEWLTTAVLDSQRKLVEVDKMLCDKSAADFSVRKLAADLTVVQVEFAALKKDAAERAARQDVTQTILDAVGMMRSQVTNVERLAQAKADTAEVRQLLSSVADLRGDLVTLEAKVEDVSTAVGEEHPTMGRRMSGVFAPPGKSLQALSGSMAQSKSLPTLSPASVARKSPTAAAAAAVLRK